MSQPSSLTGPAKLEAVSALVAKLTDDLKSANLSPHQRDSALEELKIYGRDPQDAGPIFTREGIETLTRHAFDSVSETTSHNALRCLCNALFLRPEARQIFVDLDYEAKACSKLKNDNRDDEFLVSRLIFLTTYGTNVDLGALISQHHLADTVVQNLARHAEHDPARPGKAKVDPMVGMALAETLKLLFNITSYAPTHVGSFAPAIPHIITILGEQDTPSAPTSSPLAPPLGLLINALMNLQFDSEQAQSALYPADSPTSSSDKLITLLEAAMKAYGDSELEQSVTPLVCVIRSMHEHAPDKVRQHIGNRLLPTEEDRQNVLGRGDTLSSSLLQSMTNPMTPKLGDAVSYLLFDISDKDASKFVDNVGYGFASGFLFRNNIPVPVTESEEAGIRDENDANKAFNPITGQYLDAEKLPDLPEMTQEEKEREAERLFVLFERLKKNGMISVQNPVEQAFREGRVQELDDDDAANEAD